MLLGAAAPSLAAPLAAYGKLPAIEDAEISPDGAYVALVTTDGEHRTVVIERADGQAVITRIRAGDQKVRDVRWAGSQHLLVTRSPGASTPFPPHGEWWLVVDYNLQTRQQLPLLGDDAAAANYVFEPPIVRMRDGHTYAFVESWEWQGNRGRPALYRVDLDSGRTQVDDQPPEHGEDWLVDAGGDVVMRDQYDQDRKEWRLEFHRGRGWQVVKTMTAPIEHPFLMAFASDGRSALISAYEGDNLVMRQFGPNDSDWGPPRQIPPGEDLLVDPTSDAIYGTRQLDGDKLVYRFQSAADQQAWDTVAKLFRGEVVRLESISADHRKMIVRADSPTLGPAYCVVDVTAKTAHWLGPIYDQVTEQDISPVQPVSFQAQDGLPLTGYLTLPRGKPAKDLPLIVFPHGGPAVRDEPGFDWWAQAMASRGYAVLQVNYRGSDGFGWKFLSAGFGEFGRKMQTDLSDGVQYLAGKGVIDPKRVCIVGASYGGYAALAGATLQSGVYRCAVSVAGPADLRLMVFTATDHGATLSERYWDRFMGAHGAGDPHLADISPAAHADRATIPILLIHGDNDIVVSYEQSLVMANALRRAGKPFKFVTLKSEDHWLSLGDTRLQMLQATMDFVEHNNPPN
jgi:dipeptidyl aminopeptidase/acylaminoacyl peptidase